MNGTHIQPLRVAGDKAVAYEAVQYFSGENGQRNEFGDYESDEDSTFGSFNPNLKTSERQPVPNNLMSLGTSGS